MTLVETLTTAGLEKAKESAPGGTPWISTLRTTVSSAAQPMPMEIGAAVSTGACCGKPWA